MNKKILIGLTISLLTNACFAAAGPPSTEWQVYLNKEHGFQFRYPNYAVLSDKIHNFYHINDDGCWSLIADCNQKTSANSQLLTRLVLLDVENSPHYPNYFYIAVRVGMSKDPDDIKNCLAPPSKQLSMSNKKLSTFLNGEKVLFTEIPFQDVGMSQMVKGISYRIIKNNDECWAIERFETGVNGHMTAPSSQDVPEKFLTQRYDRTLDIVNTFQFEQVASGLTSFFAKLFKGNS